MGNAIGNILSWPITPLWGTFLIALVTAWRVYASNFLQRRNEAKRDAAQIADGLLDRLDKRVQFLEAAEEKCREELAETKTDLADAKGRIAELEGYNVGQGRAMQEAAGVVAAERLKDRGK